ncbi:MAG TPA: class I SAM-dependent methyltransferase [Mucilaginibacter sp.]|nr:class I SAM-dependent methyltransferase [Mucilaginibacter sp.]
MGSAAIQGELWGRQSRDWAAIQELTCNAGYFYALNYLNLNPADKLLDIGCGSGVFSSLASATGAYVTGIDASAGMIAQAWERGTTANFTTGEMEELPFADDIFDVVCGFNSFQFAADTGNALAEARRVLKPGGKMVVMIWGNRADCEAASSIDALAAISAPAAPGSPGPFALSENQLLEKKMEEAGIRVVVSKDIDTDWNYPDTTVALRGLLSSGPATRAIAHSGFERTEEALRQSMQPFVRENGRVVYHNKLRVVIGEK